MKPEKINREKMRNPKISIVMPAFNEEKFIQTSIESIISQTYQNFELLITRIHSD